ncbi:hypothetical protein ACVW00_002778 [Marmoricola sp. URHA0025 HA25]
MVRGFVLLGPRDGTRVVVAWTLLGITRFAILVLPFSVVRRVLGEHRGATTTGAVAALDDATAIRAARIAATIGFAARHTPWRSECYPQALTARALLGGARVPHVVSFGVRRDGGQLVAHAWVHAGEVTVTGGTGHSYTEVGSFSWAPRSPRLR